MTFAQSILLRLPKFENKKLILIPTAKSLLSSILASELEVGHSNATLSTLNFPSTIQDNFNDRFNPQLHIAFVLLIMSSISTGTAFLIGLAAFGFRELCGFATSLDFVSLFQSVAFIYYTAVIELSSE